MAKFFTNLTYTREHWKGVGFFFLLFLLNTSVYLGQNVCSDQNVELGIIPWPESVIEASGELQLSSASRIIFGDNSLEPLANILREDIRKYTGLALSLGSGQGGAGDIELQVSPALSGESYSLVIEDKVLIRGGNYRAVVWGTSTLLQALNCEGRVKKVQVSDSPDANYRGLMVDLARQWHPIQNLEDIINLCRLYKVNYLQLHLTDDASFTFPSNAYPNLATPGRSYSLAELQDLETYSQNRGVTLVPELDVPGHARAMVEAYPDLFGSANKGNVINFARPAVWEAVGTLIEELSRVFQASPYIHIGGDEVDFSGLGENPEFVNAFATYQVEDVHGLFNYFINQVNGYTKSHGKKTLVWEGFNSGRTGNAKLDTDVIVCPFDNYTSANTYAGNGHDILNTSWFPLYLVPNNYVPPEVIYDWNLSIFGNYNSPWPRAHTDVKQYEMTTPEKIIGAQTCSWEQPANYEIPSLRGRLSAMAERVWNVNAGKTYSDYVNRFGKSDKVLQAILSNTIPNPITPSASYDIFQDRVEIRWMDQGAYPVLYTLYRATSDNSSSAVPILENSELTSYTDRETQEGQTYYYWVKAQNGIGSSNFGNSSRGRRGRTNLVQVYEPFDYAPGTSLRTNNGGEGFAGSWTVTQDNGSAKIINASLSYPNLKTGGNSLLLDMAGANGTYEVTRSLEGSFSPGGAEVWLSFLIKADKIGDGHCFLLFGDTGIGKQWANGVSVGSINAQLALREGETNLIVVKIEALEGNDNVHVWTNPVVSANEPDIQATNCYFGNNLDMGTTPRFGMNLQYHGEGQYVIDELRIGDSFTDVMPAEGACPDADNDGVCDADDKCPQGNDK